MRSGARGAVASPAASSTSWPTALDGTGLPGILARRPYHGAVSSGLRVRRLTSLVARTSLYAPFLDPRGHQHACTVKRPVSRGEAPSEFNSGGDEASFTSGVPHHKRSSPDKICPPSFFLCSFNTWPQLTPDFFINCHQIFSKPQLIFFQKADFLCTFPQ